MAKAIRRVGVVGAGVMGSGIAAHLANAGLPVVLLDIVPPNLTEDEKKSKEARDRFANGGLEKALKAKPAAFFHTGAARLIQTGNTEDDLAKLANVDLVIEAIIEKLEPKQALFARLETAISPECLVASNTSGLRISEMTKNRSESFRKRFLVMHFFNPVRYMKLLELVAGPDTSAETLARARQLGESVLGKGIVRGKDTPNFIGNRIGTHAMLLGIHEMLAQGLTPEDIDAITGVPMGHPKSASFRTADVVGIDTLVHVADNCHQSLTADEERAVFEVPAFIRQMVDKKILGDKTKGGFYKKVGDAIATYDPKTGDYRPRGGDEAIGKTCKALGKIDDPRARVKALVADGGRAGALAWKVISRSLAYAARRVPEITDSIAAIDDAMRWGYSWELGPFETWDALGVAETAARMKKDGIALPTSIEKMLGLGTKSFYTEDGRVWDLVTGAYVPRHADPRAATLTTMRRGKAPVLKNPGAEAWDLGDGVLGVTYRTKANSVDPDIVSMLNDACDLAERDFRALVIANEGDHFSVGANLFGVVMAANNKQWDEIEKMSRGFQYATQRLKYARVPTVAAAFGMTVGGGLEACLGCSAVQAAAETYTGLVEVGVGLLPGGGGHMNLLWRALEGVPEGATVDTYALVTQVFKNIALARVATSAVEAQMLGMFRRSDGVSFDRARLLTEAKAKAIGMAESGYHPPPPRAYRLPGESGIATLQMMVDTLVAGGYATAHDALIAGKIARILCGGTAGASHDVTEDEMLALEREQFLSVCGEPKSLERMQHMLMNNKPLRN